MVEVDVVYQGDLRCESKHGPSQQTLRTDAPKDNMGKGEAFSPTDLVGTALGTCILTIMGIVAKNMKLDINGATAHVVKDMSKEPPRRISKLEVTITLPKNYSDKDRSALENGAMSCPVHKSLHPDVDAPIKFVYPE